MERSKLVFEVGQLCEHSTPTSLKVFVVSFRWWLGHIAKEECVWDMLLFKDGCGALRK